MNVISMATTQNYTSLDASNDLSLLIENTKKRNLLVELEGLKEELRNNGKQAFLAAIAEALAKGEIKDHPVTAALGEIASRLGQQQDSSGAPPIPAEERISTSYEEKFKEAAHAILERLKKSETISFSEQALLYQFAISAESEESALAFRLLKTETPSSENMERTIIQIVEKLNEAIAKLEKKEAPHKVFLEVFEQVHIDNAQERGAVLWAAGEYLDWLNSKESLSTLKEVVPLYLITNKE